MLFQGNGKYPAMGQFGEVVSKYGGSTNAYTSSVKTNYYFSVA
jgi:secreted Zn-dependent insulinase-like peptidase